MAEAYVFYIYLVGGILYFLNKVCMLCGEWVANKESEGNWKISGWIIYLVGLAFWVIYFINNTNWIALAVELSGAPSMGFAIYFELKRKRNNWLNAIARFTLIAGIVTSIIGLILSVNQYGGFTQISQLAELGVSIGFLMGTYRLATKSSNGYIWNLVMGISAAVMLYAQNSIALGNLQIASIVCTVLSYYLSKIDRTK